MVKINEKTIWKCPYCASEYDDYCEAEDCASECVDKEEPEEEDRTTYNCEICKEEFDKCGEASDCEERHKKGDDKDYQEYKDELKKQKLVIASRHREQKRLEKWAK